MGNPLGGFIRARRDSLQPAALGLPEPGRRRSPGLRRQDVAARAGISVEYLTRIEQGRDRNPSPAVLDALARALELVPTEREHLRYLARIAAEPCGAAVPAVPPARHVRPGVRETLRLLEPGIAVLTNRLGDLLGHTGGFAAITGDSGLLDGEPPNLTRYVFTDPRSRDFLADWSDVADERAFDLWRAPSAENSEWLTAELAPLAGAEFTERISRHVVPRLRELRLDHPAEGRLRLDREVLELPGDDQQLVVLLPADGATGRAVDRLRRAFHGRLRSIS